MNFEIAMKLEQHHTPTCRRDMSHWMVGAIEPLLQRAITGPKSRRPKLKCTLQWLTIEVEGWLWDTSNQRERKHHDMLRFLQFDADVVFFMNVVPLYEH